MISKSSSEIKAEAKRLGFFSCGIARAEAVDQETTLYYERWLHEGHQAGMDYLARNKEMRLDPTLLMPGARSIICVAMNYAPSRLIAEDEYQIAYYAYGKDYHDVMRSRLFQLAEAVGATPCRVCCDTAPLLERYWAVRAGIGFIGKNRQLIIPGSGSLFFLGELLVNEPLEYDHPLSMTCRQCDACVKACPTGALQVDCFDANRCLSYHTIENRGTIPPDISKKMGHTFYGCDRCLKVCPHNRHAEPTQEPAFQASEELLSMTRARWKSLSIDDYRRLFKGSAVKRAKYDGLMRNIRLLDDDTEPSAQ